MLEEERLKKIENLLIKAHNEHLNKKTFKVIGYQFEYYYDSFGDISDYSFSDLKIKEIIAPKMGETENYNRPGIKKEYTRYICVHDTASSAKTANALAHAKYVSNGGGGTSWHYSCGDDMICHQIPDDEVAYHAGDSIQKRLEFTDTGVKATTKKPFIDIKDNYFYFNGVKSLIPCPKLEIRKEDDHLAYYCDGAFQKAKVALDSKEGIIDIEYKTSMINSEGLETIIGDNGNYYLGSVYYNKGFGYISNRGGNLNSIGIETMVNEGSNILRTWHNCAKLVSKLLIDNNLGVDSVKPHHFFSGKPCPFTMRLNNEWQHFLRMVECEYNIRKLLMDGEEIKLINNDDIVDGILDKDINHNINYQVLIKLQNTEKVLTFTTSA